MLVAVEVNRNFESQTAAQGRGEGFGFGDKQRTCKQLKNKNGLGEE